MFNLHRLRPRGVLVVGLCAAVPLLVGQGCPPVGSGGPGPAVTIDTPSLDRTMTLGEENVTIVYTTDAPTVSAFYDRDGIAGTGDEAVFATGLPNGANRVVQLRTGELAPGRIFVGIVAADGAAVTTAYAAGAITLRESISLTFQSPAQAVSVPAGTDVSIHFNAGITDFSYRVFYDQNGAFDGDEVTIAEGTSSSAAVEVSFDTSGLSPGVYHVGARVTSAAGTTATAYAQATVNIVGGVLMQVLSPTVGLQAVVGALVPIEVAANDPAAPNATVRIFDDPDNIFGNGNEETIITVPASVGGTTWDTRNTPPGEYYIGAVLENNMTPQPVAYSEGPIRLFSSGDDQAQSVSFRILEPSGDVHVLAGTPYEIRWFVDGAGAGSTLALYRDTDIDDDDQPDGNLETIATGLNPADRSYLWDTSDLSGRFFIVGQLTVPNQPGVGATSPGLVQIRPPLFWTGVVGTEEVSGTVLRGFNFQDLAGSRFSTVGDIDGDGIDDFVVISQFGKPGLVNPGGVGYGEAYLIYGNQLRLEGQYDLNRTGTKPGVTTACCPIGPFDENGICEICGLPRCTGAPEQATATDGIDQGVIFSGVAVPTGSTYTSGITSASLVPDMDGDGLNELIFGIAKADSLRLREQNIGRVLFEGLLEESQQFMRGGIVIVASTNSILRDRGALSRDSNRVIRLQQVGQVFSGRCGNPDTSDDCKTGSCGVQPCFDQVVKDSNPDDDDDHCDTFDYSEWAGRFPGYFYEWTYPRLAPDLYLCGANESTSWGMFRGGGSLEPYGCRILGQSEGDWYDVFPNPNQDGQLSMPDSHFGTSVSSIRSDSGNHLILISAPNQTPDPFDVSDLVSERPNAGVVYGLLTCNYWDPDDTTPVSVSRPHQYIIKTAGYSTSHVSPYGSAADLIRRPFYIVGPTAGARISNVTAIPDFNGDGRMDILVGSPNEGGEAGAAYIIFRRATELEGNYLLERFSLSPSDPERLYGVMILGGPGDRLGETMAGGADFNSDGYPDVMIGMPNYRDGRGAVLIVFGRPDLISPAGGFTVTEMVEQGHAALIVGEREGDLAGFNVAGAGDFDGDGYDDLLIAAPGASPRFDSTGDGLKDTIGLDFDGDGEPDDLTNAGVPTDLEEAGLVYLVSGSNTLLGEISLGLIGTPDLEGFVFVGRSGGDRLGGGESLLGLGARSHGLSMAGDVDGDGLGDILISSMLADPDGKSNAGEVYLIYGGLEP